ncbi:DUF551 domain-containing protein [Enterobacter hormaechei]|uniref:DUF551 domain-containing protein n=1 Tax=Enterobacter hormaechei TaxID=158836 RepID=UPI002074E283|nr:DUF551 domain-containing protein [Enterobacter hormaechei]MCM7844012.1 DUF551 domain-containing protein [Enterobacter hormaechei]MCM7936551.1 DUF551 domain-containing protein [Enterobacter hormaechei]
MKTFTIGWLNKCRCGNKSHSVKTARGNESALWDDDAVKCNSCGRGGVIQVCEGQARVLLETDEEMAEGKPMSTITKERAQEIFLGNGPEPTASEERELARIALASLEAEAVGKVVLGEYDDCGCHPNARVACIAADGQADWENFKDGTRLYAAPPATESVPDEVLKRLLPDAERAEFWFEHDGKILFEGVKFNNAVFEACRAAMLQGAEPVTMAYKLPANTSCKEAPEHIWLQTAGVWPENGEFSELTWCSDNQHTDDTLYVRADVAAGNFTVIPDGWVACSERMPERDYVLAADFSGKQYPANLPNIQIGIYADWFDDGCPCWDDGDGNDLHLKQVTHWTEIPAAPQQEVTQALAKGMERYGDAMNELAKREVKP